MKYIRTKDGIYEVVKEDGNWLEIISNFERKMQCHCVIKKHAVIKQADTIEELCDEFVWVSVNGEYHNRKANTYGLETSKMHRNSLQIKEIYGAIWTDKGLIYVAKMNEKGELELL